MKTIQEVNPAQAYFEGMLWAAFGVRIFSDNVTNYDVFFDERSVQSPSGMKK